ncbi:MAG: M64 family metallo-endopeptidase [Neomegalonema sp.]|nr:M64 family metallo-endopeptidase [Neomegalonema sp.]
MSLVNIALSGPSSNRVDLVALGDGYQRHELTTFTTHLSEYAAYLFTGGDPLASTNLVEPFARYQNIFNIHGAFVISQESGADGEEVIDGVAVSKATALNASFGYAGGPDRLLYIDTLEALIWRNFELAGSDIDTDLQMVTVNSEKYGGGGGSWAVWAGGNASAQEIALHETGHSYVDLADEYSYGGPQVYTGFEPLEANITTDPTGAKWAHWLGYEQEGIGTIGVYEGAGYSAEGLYRASETSKMRALGQPFDAIAREQFILAFYEDIDPLDSWAFDTLPLDYELVNPASFYVNTIDPALYDITWTLDGVEVLAFTGLEEISLAGMALTAGVHELSVLVEDNTEWVRLDRSSLQQSVSWSFTVTQASVAADNPFGVTTQEATAIEASRGDNIVRGLSLADALEGGIGEDLLRGGSGNDSLSGGAGNDTLVGQSGADALFGGAGDDLLIFDADDVEIYGGTGSDHASVASGELRAVTLDLFAHDIEQATGGAGDDILSANGSTSYVGIRGLGGNDTITGGGANDVLRGGDGDDVIEGGYGADLLSGDAGADTLSGGAGADRLYGGGDADVFVFATNGEGNDRILDFEDGIDKIAFESASTRLGVQAFDDLDIYSLPLDDNAYVDYGTGRIVVAGVTADALGEDDFIFL